MSPFSLAPNDLIALVCTGTPCESEREPHLSAEYLLKHYGFHTRYQADTFKPLSAAQRASIFYRYLQDEDVKALWSMRGGEGSADLIPFLEASFRSIQQFKPKLLIGFSDFTPMLVYFRERFGWPTLHGIGARQLSNRMVEKATEEATLRWLRDPTYSIQFTRLQALNPLAYTPTTLEAEVIGGNLTLLDISIQDRWQCHPKGKILLLEEVNEAPYRVARTLKYLQRIHFFDEVKAIILAGFDFPNKTALENERIRSNMQPIFTQFAADLCIPVLYTAQIGHGKTNLPVPFYVNARLCLGSKPTLSFQRIPMSRQHH